MNLPVRYNVLGIGVSELTLSRARDLMLAARNQRQLGYVCLCTVHGVGEGRRDPALRAIFSQSYLTTPDGMPLVWLARWLGRRDVSRVYGPDLMLAVCDAGRAVGLRHYFYGGEEGVAAQLREKLTSRFPGLSVVGTFTPPFRALTPDELSALRADVAACKPDIIWVGLGTPKQERFMAGHGRLLDAGLLVGVGAAFDFHSGRKRQAPRWMQRSGTEWLFRLGSEPRRLWRRYLLHNPLFIGRTFLQLTGLKKYPLPEAVPSRDA